MGEDIPLGVYLKAVRESRHLTLRDVEKLTEGRVSNAAISQLGHDLGKAAAHLTTQAEQIARLTARLGEVEGHADDYRDRLHDLVMIDAEEWAIGGGPGFKERRDKAWTRAREPFEP